MLSKKRLTKLKIIIIVIMIDFEMIIKFEFIDATNATKKATLKDLKN